MASGLGTARTPGDEVAAVRQTVVEECLTMHCPRCKVAFVDFEGCMALKCGVPSCGCGFCAWCLADCGDDAHKHVAECPAKPEGADRFFGTDQQCEEAWRSLRLRLVSACLDAQPPYVAMLAANGLVDELSGFGLAHLVQRYNQAM